MKPKVELTREQIEGWRVELERAYGKQAASLCDLALFAKDNEADALRLHREKMEYFEKNIAMREAIGRAVEDIDVMLGVIVEDGYIHPRLKKLRADLSQSLNPKNEEGKS